MAIKFVRKPSETPNIKNTDDFVGLRYAYGNQNGYVIGKGSECSYSINGTTFKINSCRLVLQGVEVDIDSAGVSLTITDISSKRYFTAYLQVSLATNSAEIKLETSQVNYPVISAGDDLTANTSGTARMELYRFTATGSVISDVNKVVNKLKYTEDITVYNAKKVNNVEIKKDTDGVLKVDGEIISRKKLLWSGTKTSGDSSVTTMQDSASENAIVEIEWSFLNKIYITKHQVGHIELTALMIRDPQVSSLVASCAVGIIGNSLSTANCYYYNFKTNAFDTSITQPIIITKIYEIIE